ncbi:hypothetical protein ABZP36_033686 [Zizania latifolia]
MGGQWYNLDGRCRIRSCPPPTGALPCPAEPECGDEFTLCFHDEFTLCFLDEASYTVVCGGISPAMMTLAALDGIADRISGVRVARDEG